MDIYFQFEEVKHCNEQEQEIKDGKAIHILLHSCNGTFVCSWLLDSRPHQEKVS